MSEEQRIRTLASRFMDGATTLAEERELTELCRQAELPDDLLPLRDMMLGLAAIELPHETAVEVPIDTRRQGRAIRHRLISVAASVAAFILMVGGGLYWYSGQNECVAYIYGKKCTDRKVVIEELHQNIHQVIQKDDADVESLLGDMFDTDTSM